MLHDVLGNAVTLHDPASLGPLNDFVEGFIACEARAANVLDLAEREPGALAQAYCAALHMFAESPQAPHNARPFLERARRSTGTDRERRMVEAIGAWVEGDIPRAIALHEEQGRRHPRDLVSIKLGQYHLFNSGQAAAMLRLALAALPHAHEVAYLHGMVAFGFEQCHLLEQAEASARKALGLCAKEPWAQHALAHVMLTQGRLREGHQFMAEASPGWTGLNSFMVTHNWWHLALFAIELGDPDAALRLYDEQVWGVVKAYSQDQIGAVSLLARLELAGVDVGERWQDVADHLAPRVHDHVMPFLDLQYLYGLARAGRVEAQTMLGSIEAHCMGLAPASDGNPDLSVMDDIWPRVALPAGRGLLAHAQGRHAEAVVDLGTALPRLMEIGGSHAQRDLFAQIHLDALMHSGQWSAVQQIVQPQWQAQPESRRLRGHALRAYAKLGLEGAVGVG